MFFAGALQLQLAQCDIYGTSCKSKSPLISNSIIGMTIATTLLLVLTLLFYVVDGFRRFKNLKMDQVALKNGYFVSTLIATFIFFALMGTNAGMFYEKWKITGGS